MPCCEIKGPNMSLLHPLYSPCSQLSLTSIINQCNRTNGTILSGDFFNCIFSKLLFARIIYFIGNRHCRQLLEELLLHKMLSISNTCRSLKAECFLLPALCIFPSVSIVYFTSLSPASQGADGGITADSVLILNTMKHPSCSLLNASKVTKMGWFHFVSTLNRVTPWIEYFCPCAKMCPCHFVLSHFSVLVFHWAHLYFILKTDWVQVKDSPSVHKPSKSIAKKYIYLFKSNQTWPDFSNKCLWWSESVCHGTRQSVCE